MSNLLLVTLAKTPVLAVLVWSRQIGHMKVVASFQDYLKMGTRLADYFRLRISETLSVPVVTLARLSLLPPRISLCLHLGKIIMSLSNVVATM